MVIVIQISYKKIFLTKFGRKENRRCFMKLFRSTFLKNWALLVVSNIFGQVLGLLSTIRIARVLNPDGFGQFNLMQTMASLGVVVAGLGIRNVIIRECARDHEHSFNLFFCSSIFRLISSVLTGAGILFYSRIGNSGLTYDFVWMAISLMAGMLIWDSIESVAYGYEQMEYSAAINLLGSILWVIVAWVVPVLWLTVFNVSLAFMVLQVGKAIVYWGVSVKSGIFRGRLDFRQIGNYSRQIIGDSMPFYWLALMTAVTTQLPIFFLAERSAKAEVALYNIGFRLINPLQMIILTSLTALYPVLSRYGGGRDNTRFMSANQKAINGIVIMGTLGALIISLLRNEVVFILFGSAYQLTADALAYQCWYIVLYSILCMIGTSLGANDKQGLLAKLSTAYSLISLPILWLGSGYGATGLSVAILLGCAVNMSYHWYFFQKSLPIPIRYQDTLQSLGLLIGGFVFAWFVPTIWPLMARVALSLLFCAGFVYYYLLSAGRISSKTFIPDQ